MVLSGLASRISDKVRVLTSEDEAKSLTVSGVEKCGGKVALITGVAVSASTVP